MTASSVLTAAGLPDAVLKALGDKVVLVPKVALPPSGGTVNTNGAQALADACVPSGTTGITGDTGGGKSLTSTGGVLGTTTAPGGGGGAAAPFKPDATLKAACTAFAAACPDTGADAAKCQATQSALYAAGGGESPAAGGLATGAVIGVAIGCFFGGLLAGFAIWHFYGSTLGPMVGLGGDGKKSPIKTVSKNPMSA